MRLTILRGISGSGKSTWAQAHRHEAVIISIDAFFFNKQGEYHFDIDKRPEYIKRSFRQFLEAAMQQSPWIIVDNTNISPWEFSPYVLVGEAMRYTVEILSFPCAVEVSRARKNWLTLEHLQASVARFERETRYLPAPFRPMHRLMPAADCVSGSDDERNPESNTY